MCYLNKHKNYSFYKILLDYKRKSINVNKETEILMFILLIFQKMNHLTLKINKDLINIVKSYLLPLQTIKNNRNKYLIDLLRSTCNIKERLNNNYCIDYDGKEYNNLDNSKITRLMIDYWTIKRMVSQNIYF